MIAYYFAEDNSQCPLCGWNMWDESSCANPDCVKGTVFEECAAHKEESNGHK